MKKILVSSMALVVAISCSTNNDSVENSISENSESFAKSTDSPQIESKEFTSKLLGNNFITINGASLYPANKDKMIADFISVHKKAPVIHGPYTVSIGTPGANPTNQKVTYAQVGNTYPTSGVYIADVYNYFLKVQVPSNAVTAWVESVDNPGYANYTTQTVGFNTSMATENGNKFCMGNTYTMVLTHNIVGQLINAVVPAASGAKTFTYYYLTT